MRKWKSWLRSLERIGLTAWYALRDPRVSLPAKLVQVAGLFYLFLPVDLIPDIIPVIGWLDDMAILPLFTYAFMRMMPVPVRNELEQRAAATVDKWGGWFFWGGLIVIVLWIGLAAVGGYLFITSGN